MDKDKVKGAFDDAAGRAKRQIGEWTNDPNKQAEGAAQQIKGKAEKISGNVKDAIRDATKHSSHDPVDDDANVDREHTSSGNRR